jgi:thiamine biosynthesis protein ThiI
MNHILIHWSEIGLKGRNQPEFVARLLKNIRVATAGIGVSKISRRGGGFLIEFEKDLAYDSLEKVFGKIPGVANFMGVCRVSPDLTELKKGLASSIISRYHSFFGRTAPRSGISGRTFETFAVAANRSDKLFPLGSQEINREIGEWIIRQTGAAVDLERPDFTIFIEASQKEILFGFEKMRGLGGLPAGSSGTAVSMLSGGIDSPVAAFQMMKRGCRIVFAHFHSYPYIPRTSQEKAIQLVQALNRYQYDSTLYLIPFGDLQKRLLLEAPPRYLVILYRRFMVRIAEAIARREHAGALVTGESVGQVASQTLENMGVVGAVAILPLLRPLAGTNKEEIIAQARRIGTYDISIIPDQDCCQLFVPKHPATRAKLEIIERIEVNLPIEELVNDALAFSEKKEF